MRIEREERASFFITVTIIGVCLLIILSGCSSKEIQNSENKVITNEIVNNSIENITNITEKNEVKKENVVEKTEIVIDNTSKEEIEIELIPEEEMEVEMFEEGTLGAAAPITSRSTTEVREDLTSLGTYTLTAYCACSQCCGKSDGITASGTRAAANRTIAAPKNFAFGTKLQIKGKIYTVEDRGGAIEGKRIDIYFDSHAEALAFGRQKAEVFQFN